MKMQDAAVGGEVVTTANLIVNQSGLRNYERNRYSTSGWLSEVGNPSRLAIWLYFCWSSRTRFSALATSTATDGLYPRAKSLRFVSTNWASFSSISLNVLRRSSSTTRCCSCYERPCCVRAADVPSKKTNKNITNLVSCGQEDESICVCCTSRLAHKVSFFTSSTIKQTSPCSSQWTLSTFLQPLTKKINLANCHAVVMFTETFLLVAPKGLLSDTTLQRHTFFFFLKKKKDAPTWNGCKIAVIATAGI